MLTRSFLYNKLSSAVILLLMAALYALNVGIIGDMHPAATQMFAQRTLLGEWIYSVEVAHPLLASLLAVAMIIVGAIVVTSSTIKYNMHGVTTHLPAMVYIALFAAFSRPDDLLAPPITALLMSLSVKGLYDVYGDQEGSHRLYNAVFMLGIIPLIYPSMVLLAPLLALIYTIFDRNGREVVVVVAAFFAPLLIQLYTMWLVGDMVGVQLEAFCCLFMHSCGGVGEIVLPFVSISLFILVGLFVVRNIDDLSITLMSRRRTLYAVALFVLSLLPALSPSYTLAQLLIVAPSLAIFTITAIALLPERWAHYLYLALFLLLAGVSVAPYLLL